MRNVVFGVILATLMLVGTFLQYYSGTTQYFGTFYEQIYNSINDIDVDNKLNFIPDLELYQKWKNHTQHCYNRTLTVKISATMGTYSLRCLFLSVQLALHLNRTLFITTAGSKYIPWEYFFAEVNPPHCTLPPPANNTNNIGFELKADTQINEFENIDHVWLQTESCTLLQGKKDDYMIDSVDYMYRAAGLVFQFQQNVKLELKETLSIFPNWANRKYHSMQIRRGDKIFGPAQESKFEPIEKYFEILEKENGNITDPVFIAADSVTSIEEVIQKRKNWNIWYINNTRLEKLRKGSFVHSETYHWALEDRIYFYKMFLAEIVMMRFSDSFVGTGTSNVYQLIFALRNRKKSYSIN